MIPEISTSIFTFARLDLELIVQTCECLSRDMYSTGIRENVKYVRIFEKIGPLLDTFTSGYFFFSLSKESPQTVQWRI